MDDSQACNLPPWELRVNTEASQVLPVFPNFSPQGGLVDYPGFMPLDTYTSGLGQHSNLFTV